MGIVATFAKQTGAARAGIVLACVGAFVLAACITNDRRDAHCSPTTDDDRCIYAGEGLGPKVDEEACPRVEGDAPSTCPSFDDVFTLFTDATRGGCVAGGCHGVEANAAVGIYLPSKDPDELYAALTAIEGSVGRPYLDADDPPASWLVCNLAGEPGGGFPMPVAAGLDDPADVALVRDWVLCGAEPPAQCPADASDGECGACGRDRCCEAARACLDDAACAPCASCLATGDRGSCAADCPDTNETAARLVACVGARCGAECPKGAP